MSNETTTEAPAVHEPHEHPSDFVYVKIALILAVLTGIEIAISYTSSLNGGKATAMLLILAAIKFTTVALYFMHLKYESPVVKRVFIAGLLFAIGIYCAYLMTLHVFSKEWGYVVGAGAVVAFLGMVRLLAGMLRRSPS